jgi:hypothetical protein
MSKALAECAGRCRKDASGYGRLLWLAALLFAGGGASCHNLASQYTAPVPRALPSAPSLADVVRVVNDNSARVQSLYTTDATLSGPLIPASLKTSIALERPQRFRLRGDHIVGPEVDLGSNDQLFWFWVRRNQPPALYFCRHEQFATSPLRRVIPVEPAWLIEALGLVYFDPNLQHHGPHSVGAGRLRIESPRPTLYGQLRKVTEIDETRAWVVAQHLYDERNGLVASALASDHRRDAATDVTLPREIEIQWPASQLTLKVRVNQWQVNALGAGSASLWTMPEYPGWNAMDLGNPGLALPETARR